MHLTPGYHFPFPTSHSQGQLATGSHPQPKFNTRLIEPEFDVAKKVQRWEMYRNDDINRSNQRKRTNNWWWWVGWS